MIDEKSLNVFIRDYTKEIKKQNDYIGYGIATVATFATLVTANFHDYFFLKAHVIEALFLFCFVMFLVLTVKSAYHAWKVKGNTPEALINKIKNENEKSTTTTVETLNF